MLLSLLDNGCISVRKVLRTDERYYNRELIITTTNSMLFLSQYELDSRYYNMELIITSTNSVLFLLQYELDSRINFSKPKTKFVCLQRKDRFTLKK